MYRIQHHERRHPGSAFNFFNLFSRALFVKVFLENRHTVNSWFNSPYTQLIWNLLELSRGLAFTVFYLLEIQWNSIYEKPKTVKPEWIAITRPDHIFSLLLFLSITGMVARIIGILFSEGNKKAFLRLPMHIMDVVLSISIISLSFFKNGPDIYIPYFLYSILIIPLLKPILRSKTNWRLFKVTNYSDNLILLLANILLIIFLGICFFNFFENNFGLAETVFRSNKISLLDTAYFMV